MSDSDPNKLSVEEQVARIKAAKEAAKAAAAAKLAAEKAAVAPAIQAAVAASTPVAPPAPAPVAPPAPIAPPSPAPVVAAAPAPAPAAPAAPVGPPPTPGSVEEKVAQIKAAKAAAAEKAKAAAAAKAGGAVPAAAPVAAAAAPTAPAGPPPAPGSVEEKVAQIKAAKAAAAEKAKADAAAKAAGTPLAAEVATGAAAVGDKTTPPGTPEAIAKAAAAREKALGATGINAHGTPANKPALVLLTAAKPGAATAAKKPKDPELPLPPPPQMAPRRLFLGFLTLGTGAWLFFWAWLAATGALFTRFMFPNVLYESDPKFNAGRKNDFPEAPKVYEKFKQDQAVWIVRLTEEGQDRLVALSTVCTHLGCTPNWLEVEQKYKCPCHGSGYYIDGVNFEGPTPRPLERFRIFVDGTGNIIVDKSKKFRQDLAQWNENQSYVTMG